jgi:hypothetical protein
MVPRGAEAGGRPIATGRTAARRTLWRSRMHAELARAQLLYGEWLRRELVITSRKGCSPAGRRMGLLTKARTDPSRVTGFLPLG